ncbi:TlpA family protein disulfide reductase [Curtobacterium ammoniigenes]|uniref:TlpA family protein disulfide reductase n=1 Tax=Curtobacterium ammoniigenes TaxID=395387 RepID=UPI000ACEC980|nr:TlpA family protein disulfide reductase [Curtobacterium ammoniigenes]
MLAASTALIAVTALAGCASSSNKDLSAQYGKGTTQNYISGTGAVSEIALDERKAPVTFSATATDGSPISSAALRGKVVVLNFWYAGCPPCRAEAKYLKQSYATFHGQGVEFVGIDVRDEAGTAAAFDRTFQIPYPTVLDAQTGTMQLALSGAIAPNAVPTTIVLDKQGRVAARVLGAIDGQSILDTLVSDALAGRAS